jgi:hypothetical protein
MATGTDKVMPRPTGKLLERPLGVFVPLASVRMSSASRDSDIDTSFALLNETCRSGASARLRLALGYLVRTLPGRSLCDGLLPRPG